MKDEDKTREELLAEVALLRKRVTELEAGDSERDCRRAEGALRQSQELFRLLVETAFDGINICEWDPVSSRRRLIFCNDRFVQMSGYTREELENAENLDALVVPHDPQDKWEPWRERLLKGLPTSGTSSWKRPDGKENIHEWSAVCVKVGDKYHMLGFDRDVAERKRAERALRGSEERFRLLVETAFDGINICEWDSVTRKRRLLFCNDRYVEMSGYTREQLENAPNLSELSCSEATRQQSEKNHRCFEEGTPVSGTASWIRPDGKENTYEYSALSVKVGDKYHIMGFDRDITERKRAEEALRDSEEKYRVLVEGSPSAIFMIDADGRYVYANIACARFHGQKPTEVIGKRLADLFPEEQAKQMLRNVLHAFGEDRVVRREGAVSFGEELRYFVTVLSPVHDAKGDVVSVMGIAHDITERKQIEERLLEYQRRLRSLALRLSTAEEGERRRIASDLHDDVAQALGVAKMKLTELPLSLDSHDVAEQVGEVVQLVDQALQAIGSLTFELSPPVLYELGLVPALEQLAEQMHEQHGIAIDVEGDGRSKILDEDLRVLLFRAVRELLINVVKHAKAENVKVSVREHRDDTEINVEDDGVGFEQAEPESRAVGSCGFGLFSIKERLEHLGGQLQIRSKSGQGTCVTLTVPLRRGRRRRAETT